MRLTVFTDYALRVLMYLALDPGRRVTIRDVAEDYGVSRNHLMKVVNKLTRAEFVESSRGVNGGLLLAHAPEDIVVGDVVRHTEDDFALVECFRDDNACVITPSCHLKQVLYEARESFFGVLDSYTIADLVQDHRGLTRLLGLAG